MSAADHPSASDTENIAQATRARFLHFTIMIALEVLNTGRLCEEGILGNYTKAFGELKRNESIPGTLEIRKRARRFYIGVSVSYLSSPCSASGQLLS